MLQLPAVVRRDFSLRHLLPEHRVLALHRALDLQEQITLEGQAVQTGRVISLDQHQRLHHVAGE